MSKNTLVLGGGGVTGIAWTIGLLTGIEQRGIAIRAFDTLIGTSAGANVAAQISSGLSMEELYLRQCDTAKQAAEITPSISLMKTILKLMPAFLVKRDALRFRQRIGKMAMAAKTVSVEQRREVIKGRTPHHEWPEIRILIMAINAASGELVQFTKHSGVDFLDAISASSAVPGIWPCVPINGEHYFDGGIRSSENADFATGTQRAVIVSPLGARANPFVESRLDREIKILEAQGTKTELLIPDLNSRQAMGRNPLDPSRRKIAAESGYRQGLAYAGQ